MLLRRRLLAGALALAAIAGAGAAPAKPPLDLVAFDTLCPRNRDPRALRQTIVVLDEALVSADAESNQRWIRMIVDAADARENATWPLGARERFSLLLARRDGSEAIPVFLACAPTFTQEEIERGKTGDHFYDRFFGTDSDSRRKKLRSDYAGALARALVKLQRQAPEASTEAPPRDAFVRALRGAGRLFDPANGIPRIVLVTPFTIAEAGQVTDVPSARRAGFAQSERSGLDLGRAEVYLAGASLGDGPRLEFARAYLLRARGNLIASRSDALPQPAPEPVSVQVYSGFMDFIGDRIAMQMRFATSATGELVNSWIEHDRSGPVATPLDGRAICHGLDCELQSRGRFARVWLADPQSEPQDRSDLPFGAARDIEIKISGGIARGTISDRRVSFRANDANNRPVEVKELRFELKRMDGGQF